MQCIGKITWFLKTTEANRLKSLFSLSLLFLLAVAAKTKTMDDSFINDAGNNVTQAFSTYCRPLVGSGFPRHYRLRAPIVGTPGS